ncbi:hypothetical protein BH23DEI1_BH23DEI1_05030 [soil metagenome]
MTIGMFDGHDATSTPGAPLDQAATDHILTAQLVVAWAGERGDPPRLGWWRSDLSSEFGGEDLFRRLLPHTWPWATLQATREVARRHDAQLRRQARDPDQLITLFALGWAIDEQVDERLADLKRHARPPTEALPGLTTVIQPEWSVRTFEAWVGEHAAASTTAAPVGRRLAGDPPSDPIERVSRLIAALHPLSEAYPLPYYARRT